MDGFKQVVVKKVTGKTGSNPPPPHSGQSPWLGYLKSPLMSNTFRMCCGFTREKIDLLHRAKGSPLWMWFPQSCFSTQDSTPYTSTKIRLPFTKLDFGHYRNNAYKVKGRVINTGHTATFRFVRHQYKDILMTNLTTQLGAKLLASNTKTFLWQILPHNLVQYLGYPHSGWTKVTITWSI